MKNMNLNTINNDEWLTPPEIIKALGEFDLDPCSPINRPWDTAKHHFTEQDNGLLQEWTGRVWLNPPYGRALEAWITRMALHKNGIALIPARTETKAFQHYVFPNAHGILFVRNRIKFYDINGKKHHNANFASLLIAFDSENARILEYSGIKGFFINI